MVDFVTLTCPSCGGDLQITQEINRFACNHCGKEHIVNRTGNIIFLKPVIEEIGKVRMGVDKTASELALQRLQPEINRMKSEVDSIRENLQSGYIANGYHTVLIGYFIEQRMYREKFEGAEPQPFWKSNIEKEIESLTIDGLYKLYQHFLNPELRKPGFLSRKKPVAVQITDLLEPIVEIRAKLREKEVELEKHKRIVAS
jgi:hypothetical protein